MKAQIESRRLNELKATNAYLRLGTDVTDLEKSIATVGLISPLVISSNNVILAGARRFQALLNLGHTEAPVIVIGLGELEQELISIDENLVRKDLTKIEIEGHLRRAKEIYVALNPVDEQEEVEITAPEDQEENVKKEILPAEKFLTFVAEKTGLSPKQIHEAINRDELADKSVKEARKNGELTISQTNELVKLSKEEQKKSLHHIKGLPVKEVRSFVKKAKTVGIDEAIRNRSDVPHAREFNEIEMLLKKLQKKLKQLELEGIGPLDLPEETARLLNEISLYGENKIPVQNREDHQSLYQ